MTKTTRTLQSGKLDNALLEAIVLRHVRAARPEVLTRPGVGEDCAVIDYGETECVVSTDPITAAASSVGALAVHAACNDIASNGVPPLGLMLAVLLPEGTTEAEVEAIMRQTAETASALNVDILGGHTEITPAVTKPVVVATALGRAPKGTSRSAKDMRPGDVLLMTKRAGMEGTTILAADRADELAATLDAADARALDAMRAELSVVREGVIGGVIGVSGMHDVTEGGILGAVWEMCALSETGAELRADDIPVADVTRRVCARFGIDVLRLISGGAMLMAARPEKARALTEAVRAAGIDITEIGRVTARREGIRMSRDGIVSDVDPPGADEIYGA